MYVAFPRSEYYAR